MIHPMTEAKAQFWNGPEWLGATLASERAKGNTGMFLYVFLKPRRGGVMGYVEHYFKLVLATLALAGPLTIICCAIADYILR